MRTDVAHIQLDEYPHSAELRMHFLSVHPLMQLGKDSMICKVIGAYPCPVATCPTLLQYADSELLQGFPSLFFGSRSRPAFMLGRFVPTVGVQCTALLSVVHVHIRVIDRSVLGNKFYTRPFIYMQTFLAAWDVVTINVGLTCSNYTTLLLK